MRNTFFSTEMMHVKVAIGKNARKDPAPVNTGSVQKFDCRVRAIVL
jgi:hypothetical protein